MIEMLDHTADVGFEPGASTLDELFDETRRALIMVVLERPPGEPKGILVRAAGRATVDEEMSEACKDAADVIEATRGAGHRAAR